MGPGERTNLIVRDPTQIPIFNLLKMLILVAIKHIKVKKPCFSCLVDASQDAEDRQLVRAYARRRVVEGWERGIGVFERCERFLRAQAQVQHGVGGDHRDTVRAPMAVGTAVVVNLLVRQASIVQLCIQFLAETVELPQVQGTEVQEKIPVHKFIVCRKVVLRSALSRVRS